MKDKYEQERFEQNLQLWSDILRDDEPFDYAYLEMIILHKIKLMRDYYQSGASPIAQTSIDRIVDEMTLVIEALERLIADDYIHFPKETTTEWEEVENPDGVKEYRLRYLTDHTPEEIKQVYEVAEQNKRRDRHLVYDTLRDRATNWWD